MPGAMQEVRPDEHNGPSGLRIYGVYQILQKVMSLQTGNMKIEYTVTVTLYVKWGSETKHCKLEGFFYLLKHIRIYMADAD